MKSMMDDNQGASVASAEGDDAPIPSDDVIMTKWPELAGQYTSMPRLASMLSSSTLTIEDADDAKIVTFRVINEAQKDWVESKLLHELEGRFRSIVGSMKIYLRVSIVPEDNAAPKTAYMPSERAKELMSENEQVKNLVKDLGLDIK